MPSVLDLVGAFYRLGTRYLPVVDPVKAEVIGVLSRDHITAISADHERARLEFETIPPEIYLEQPLSPAVMQDVGAHHTVFVLFPDLTESKQEASGVLAMLSHYRKKMPVTAHAKDDTDASHPEDVKLWLSRILLASVPLPLFAIDLHGKTLFYNGDFEKQILSGPPFGRSLARAEKYFLELSRSTLANAVAEGLNTLRATGQISRGDSFTMISLQDAGKVIGYLFALASDKSVEETLAARIRAGTSIDNALDKIEKNLLVDFLAESGYNISKTAQLMKTRRTTLQSRMKRLNIPLKAAKQPKGTKPVKAAKTTRSKRKKQGARKKVLRSAKGSRRSRQ